MEALSTTQANVLRADLRTVDEKIKAEVTLQQSKAQDKRWGRWDKFSLENGINPFLSPGKTQSPSYNSLASVTMMVEFPPERTPSELEQWRAHCVWSVRRSP
jgi:hypothetical protein